jgi:hypothetical protein
LDIISRASMAPNAMGNTMADFLRAVAAANGANGVRGTGYLPSHLMRNIASQYWATMKPRAPQPLDLGL